MRRGAALAVALMCARAAGQGAPQISAEEFKQVAAVWPAASAPPRVLLPFGPSCRRPTSGGRCPNGQYRWRRGCRVACTAGERLVSPAAGTVVVANDRLGVEHAAAGKAFYLSYSEIDIAWASGIASGVAVGKGQVLGTCRGAGYFEIELKETALDRHFARNPLVLLPLPPAGLPAAPLSATLASIAPAGANGYDVRVEVAQPVGRYTLARVEVALQGEPLAVQPGRFATHAGFVDYDVHNFLYTHPTGDPFPADCPHAAAHGGFQAAHLDDAGFDGWDVALSGIAQPAAPFVTAVTFRVELERGARPAAPPCVFITVEGVALAALPVGEDTERHRTSSCDVDECASGGDAVCAAGDFQACADPDQRMFDDWRCECTAPATGAAVLANPAACRIDECQAAPCGSAQACADADPLTRGDYVCSCVLPYVGADATGAAAECVYDECTANTCTAGGQACKDVNVTAPDDWECQCVAPWAGTAAVMRPAECSLDECDGNTACSDAATPQTCVEPDTSEAGDWVCGCTSPYIGSQRAGAAACRVDECRVTTTCGDARQTCNDPDDTSEGDYVCSCVPPYVGADVTGAAAECVYDECTANTCTAGGQACKDVNVTAPGDWECQCVAPWTGAAAVMRPAECALDECDGNTACSDAATPQTCVEPDTSEAGDWVCGCTSPYIGSQRAGAAACRVDECRVTTVCVDAGQMCNDPDDDVEGDWECRCDEPAPARFSVGSAADCSTPRPSTDAPPTPAPLTVSPPTPAPLTNAPPTPAPLTDAPPTPGPLTQVPPTPKALTDSPPTPSPLTDAPPTPVPVTVSPPTPAPLTDAPPTPGPLTQVPPTPKPLTDSPPTPSPLTDAPPTPGPPYVPSTSAPRTLQAPTVAPPTRGPMTGTPATPSPPPDECAEHWAVCAKAAQACADPSSAPGDWVCECAPPLVGVGRGAPAACRLPAVAFAMFEDDSDVPVSPASPVRKAFRSDVLRQAFDGRGAACECEPEAACEAGAAVDAWGTLTLGVVPNWYGELVVACNAPPGAARPDVVVAVAAVNDAPTAAQGVGVKEVYVVGDAPRAVRLPGWATGVDVAAGRNPLEQAAQEVTLACASASPAVAGVEMIPNAARTAADLVVRVRRAAAAPPGARVACRVTDSGGAEAPPLILELALRYPSLAVPAAAESEIAAKAIRTRGAVVEYRVRGGLLFRKELWGRPVAVSVRGPGSSAAPPRTAPPVTLRTAHPIAASADALQGRAAAAAAPGYGGVSAEVTADGAGLQLRLKDDGYRLYPPHRERVEVGLAPGLFGGDAAEAAAFCAAGACTHRLTITPETPALPGMDGVQAVVETAATVGLAASLAGAGPLGSAGANAGILAMSAEAAKCPSTDGPDRLDRTLNPLGLQLGRAKYDSHNGGVVGTLVMVLGLVSVCSAVAWWKRKERRVFFAKADVPLEGGVVMKRGGYGVTYVLLCARFGPLLIPAVFLYSGTVVASGTVLLYSDALYKALAVVAVLAVVAALPLYLYIVATAAPLHAEVVAIEGGGALSRAFWGTQEWVPKEKHASHGRAWALLHRLAFDAFVPKWRRFLVGQCGVLLTLGCLIAWHPATPQQCWARACAMAAVLAALTLFIAAARPYLAPYENVMELLIHAAETGLMVCTLLAMDSPRPDLSAPGVLAQRFGMAAAYLLLAKLVMDMVVYFIDEYEVYREGGGSAGVAPCLVSWFCCRTGHGFAIDHPEADAAGEAGCGGEGTTPWDGLLIPPRRGSQALELLEMSYGSCMSAEAQSIKHRRAAAAAVGSPVGSPLDPSGMTGSFRRPQRHLMLSFASGCAGGAPADDDDADLLGGTVGSVGGAVRSPTASVRHLPMTPRRGAHAGGAPLQYPASEALPSKRQKFPAADSPRGVPSPRGRGRGFPSSTSPPPSPSQARPLSPHTHPLHSMRAPLHARRPLLGLPAVGVPTAAAPSTASPGSPAIASNASAGRGIAI